MNVIKIYAKVKLIRRMGLILRQLSIFLIGNTFISLHIYIYAVPNLEEFLVEPERQYFPLVGFALRRRGVGRFCLNAKSFKFDAFSHFRSGL